MKKLLVLTLLICAYLVPVDAASTYQYGYKRVVDGKTIDQHYHDRADANLLCEKLGHNGFRYNHWYNTTLICQD